MNSIYPMNPLGGYPINPYASFTNPINPVVPNYQPVVSQGPRMEIQRVNGKESAYAYSIGPNSSVVLVDNLSPRIWIVTTDSSGFKAVNGFKIVPDDEESAPIVDDPIKQLTKRLDELEERMNGYGKSNSKSSMPNKSGNAGNQPNDRNGQGGEGSNGSNSANVGK